MKRIDFSGWRNVYSFTLTQTLKTKSYQITVLIMCLLAAAVMPAMYYISGADKAKDNNDIDKSSGEDTKIEYLDNLYISYDKADTSLDEVYKSCSNTFDCKLSYADVVEVEKLRGTINDNKNDCIIVIDKSKGYYEVNAITSWNMDDIMNDVDKITLYMSNKLQDIQINSVISADKIKDAEKEVVGYIGNDEKGYSDDLNMNKYIFQLMIITVLIFIMTFAGESIASSIVTEKSCRIVEYLMTSIKPMAIVAGKVLAVLTTVFIQVFSMFVSSVIVGMIFTSIVNVPVMSSFVDSLKKMSDQGMIANISPLLIVLIVLIMLGGFLFFSLLASLAGAAVSKLEEMSEGIVIFTFVLIIGGYMGIALAMNQMMDNTSSGHGVYGMVCYLLPISAMFTIPENMLFGDVTMWIAGLSMVIEYLFVGVLLILTSKVYEYLLFYNGAVLKFKDIVYIAIHGRKREVK